MTSDRTNTYTWDSRNRLSAISGLYSASFEYDPFGRRLQKTISGTTTDFLYDGVNAVQELSGTTPRANLLTGLGVDEYLTRTDSTGTANFLRDALSSTIALADSTGTVQTEYTYDPYGGTTTQGAASSNPYQFTGRENDGDGVYYYRSRYFDPMLSRFIGEDPLSLSGGSANLYAYAWGDPVGYGDPLGLWRWPDFVQANVNVAIVNPFTGTLVGWSGTASLDRYGNPYWSPLGLGVGKSATLVSGSLTADWLDRACTPTPGQLNNFLTKSGFNATAGFWGGASESYTPGAGWATGVGVVSPQAGVSYNYSFQGGHSGLGWSLPGSPCQCGQ